MVDLKQKTCLVTGASRGIGRAIALSVAEAGGRVVVHYNGNEKEAENVVSQVRSRGGTAEKVQQDLRDPGGPQRLAEQLRHMGYAQLDAIILNAGINRPGPLSGMSISDFDDLFAVNVRAPYFLVQQLLSLTHPGASIVFISSLAAKAAIGRLSAYAATKGALDTIVKHLAVELGETGIRVNGLAPGVVQTESSSITQSESGRDATLELQAFKRLAIPEDIAKVAAFLASDEARWITGQIVHVDGGSKL